MWSTDGELDAVIVALGDKNLGARCCLFTFVFSANNLSSNGHTTELGA